MADQGSALPFEVIEYHPGNPLFPTLSDPDEKNLIEYGVTAATSFDIPSFESAGSHGIEVDRRELVHRKQGAGHAGAGLESFGDWYLGTIWITPSQADFGDITNDKDVTVTVHNTHTVNQSLDSSDTSGIDGLSLSAPGLPQNIGAFASEELTLTVTKDGPDQFDDFITFTFSLDGVVSYRCIGQRILFFKSFPQSGITEQIIFASDLMRSKDGTEKSFGLRLAPKSKVKMGIKFSDEDERATAHAVLFGGSPALEIGIQLWWQAETTTALISSGSTVIPIDTTRGSWAVGDTISFVLPDRTSTEGEIATVSPTQLVLTQAVGVELPTGTSVMPMRFGYLSSNVSMGVRPLNLEEMKVEFTTYDEQDLSALDLTYFDQYAEDSLPIITKRWALGKNALANMKREQEVMDGGTGIVAVRSSETIGEYGTAVEFPLATREEIFAYLQFLHFVRGSWGKFYMPTFQRDLPLDADFVLGGNTFTTKSLGFKTFLDGKVPKRDIRIQLDDGTIEYRRITAIVDNGTTEVFTVNGTVGSSGTSLKEATTISWMHLSRIQGDVATFVHRYPGISDLKFNVRSVKE